MHDDTTHPRLLPALFFSTPDGAACTLCRATMATTRASEANESFILEMVEETRKYKQKRESSRRPASTRGSLRWTDNSSTKKRPLYILVSSTPFLSICASGVHSPRHGLVVSGQHPGARRTYSILLLCALRPSVSPAACASLARKARRRPIGQYLAKDAFLRDGLRMQEHALFLKQLGHSID